MWISIRNVNKIMGEKNIVCHGAICMCNFGAVPDKLAVKSHKKSLTIGHPSGCWKIRTYKIQIQSAGEWKEVYSKLEDIK